MPTFNPFKPKTQPSYDSRFTEEPAGSEQESVPASQTVSWDSSGSSDCFVKVSEKKQSTSTTKHGKDQLAETKPVSRDLESHNASQKKLAIRTKSTDAKKVKL